MHLCYELIERLIIRRFAEIVCILVEYDFAESHCHWYNVNHASQKGNASVPGNCNLRRFMLNLNLPSRMSNEACEVKQDVEP